MQKYINKISRKYKDKKIIVYGAGSFSKSIFEKYDLSELNIIAVADLKFETALEKEFYGYKGVSPEDISNLKADIILIANEDYNYFSMVVENILAKNCIKKVHIIPLIKQKQRRIKISDIFFESLYVLFNPKDFASLILRIMAKLASFYIVDRYERRIRYEHLYNIFGTRLYGAQVLKTAKSIGKKFWCGGFSSVTKNTVLKDRVCFNGMKIIGNGKVTIGNYFHSGTDVLIITQNHNYDKGIAIPYDITYIFKDIEIGDFVWIGSNVIILPGTKIGEGAIIQAGSVVHGEIPPYSIAGGNPAKVFKYRDVEHFEKLKSEGKFH